MESSLYRAFKYAENITEKDRGKPKKIARISHEKLALRRFINSAHLFLEYRPPTKESLEWFSIMQHYGAPTRLCDFTFSPYVAMYFALESGTEDATIYCVSITQRLKIIEDLKLFRLDNDRQLLYLYEPKYPTQRLLAQQGVFLVPGTLKYSHHEIINTMGKDTERLIMKIIIPARLRYEGLRRLRKYNINSAVLFPGLEGFCKTFNYQGLFKLSDEERIGEYLRDYPEGS